MLLWLLEATVVFFVSFLDGKSFLQILETSPHFVGPMRTPVSPWLLCPGKTPTTPLCCRPRTRLCVAGSG